MYARTRFAPSPTGELHLGHVAHASWVWRTATAHGASVIVRMEDHDRKRCTPEYEASILDDLEWLGFTPDPVSLTSLRTGTSAYRQSDHAERYEAAFATLCGVTEVYPCTCTRAMLEPSSVAGERRYGGRCRTAGLDQSTRHVLRARIPEGVVSFTDLNHGEVRQDPQAELGDVAIRDANGQWTYQFCVVVDDMHDEVDLVVRGQDLLASTGRQWLLAKMLGRKTPPATLHHPLVVDAKGRKLSKRDRSETVGALRERGLTAAEVIQLAGAGSP